MLAAVSLSACGGDDAREPAAQATTGQSAAGAVAGQDKLPERPQVALDFRSARRSSLVIDRAARARIGAGALELELEPEAEPLAEVDRPAPASDDGGFRALWSSGRPDDDVLQTTQPGDPLQLFGAPEPAARRPSAALAAFATAPASATTAPSRPAGETASERRERLREERQALVAAISRRTGEPHRSIHGRMNRATGARSVGGATAEQLAKGNRLLEHEARRG